MSKRNGTTASKKKTRRTYTSEFKQEAVQMLLDGHSAASVSKNLGIDNTNVLYRWKAEVLTQNGPTAKALDIQLSELRE